MVGYCGCHKVREVIRNPGRDMSAFVTVDCILELPGLEMSNSVAIELLRMDVLFDGRRTGELDPASGSDLPTHVGS